MCPADCKVDLPNSKPMPRVLISIAQERKKSPDTVKKSMHFPFHMTQRENVILVNYLSGGHVEKLFGIQRLQHNVRKLFYLTASSQDHSFKYCGKIYLLLNASETELFSKAKKVSHLYICLFSDPSIQ